MSKPHLAFYVPPPFGTMQAASPPPSSDKTQWRKWFRQRLPEASSLETQAAEIRKKLETRLQPLPACAIASFAALPGEPNLLPLLQTLRQHHWYFPKVSGLQLHFHEVHSLDDFVPGAYGILEPATHTPFIETAQLDVLLCPGLGFGRDGSRLGRGKGFYDRVLTDRPLQARAIGIAFREQIVESVPTDPHDQSLDELISPG
ncbi:MAG: 5-formyltetrahydrofolate cyclo-ligase [Verrucomicrobiales bacterium]